MNTKRGRASDFHTHRIIYVLVLRDPKFEDQIFVFTRILTDIHYKDFLILPSKTGKTHQISYVIFQRILTLSRLRYAKEY